MGRGNLGQNTTSGSDSMNKMVNQLIRKPNQINHKEEEGLSLATGPNRSSQRSNSLISLVRLT